MKKVKLLTLIIFTVILVYSVIEGSLSYSNKESLVYDGNSKTFTYINLNKEDLFVDLKGLMPGDKKTQVLNINLNNINNNNKMYIRILKDNDILDKINFKIYKDSKVIFDNKKDIDNYNYLINIYKDGDLKKFSIILDLEVPTYIGNEIQDIKSNLEWIFLVEDEGNYSEVVQTAVIDRSVIYIITSILSLLIIILLIKSIEKENKGNNK